MQYLKLELMKITKTKKNCSHSKERLENYF